MLCFTKILCVLALLALPLAAQQPALSTSAPPEPIMLWPTGAPGALGTEDTDKPALFVFLPTVPNPTKTGVVVAPGGGYQHLAMEKEGFAVARWLNQHGVAAFVLRYRLGPQYHHPIEIGDAQRAIRMVRAHADEYGIDKDRVGMWGFSAGGHLTATAGTQFDAGHPDSTDPIDHESSRPEFLVLAYPVITLMAPSAHTGSRKYLLGDDPDPALVRSMSAETRVTPETPPTFLFATTDDKTVPVMNSVLFYEALIKAGVPAEMHLFQHGSHGAGLAQANPDLSIWPDLLIKWMRERGYAAPAGQ
ncbi:MAG: alpha/beta hydrolase [Edaphobacter sp.]|uniref:alpha/beta hydrolase n=1 Tax=Edaphobacter sp. TaxID=1934404 RepID=UPI00239624CE|nr:alpha/beta hydrolase [Edaphobacter sp.]MDE1175997.1 alpha/beta hydrolase [Edaphobacter sp.]